MKRGLITILWILSFVSVWASRGISLEDSLTIAAWAKYSKDTRTIAPRTWASGIWGTKFSLSTALKNGSPSNIMITTTAKAAT